jgi:hypothetical protein
MDSLGLGASPILGKEECKVGGGDNFLIKHKNKIKITITRKVLPKLLTFLGQLFKPGLALNLGFIKLLTRCLGT